MDDFLTVKITSPEKVVWEGRAEAVSSENADGPFDILPQHANFITLITDAPIVVHRSDGRREFEFDKAVIYTKENEVTVYANLGQAVEVVEKSNKEEKSRNAEMPESREKEAPKAKGGDATTDTE